MSLITSEDESSGSSEYEDAVESLSDTSDSTRDISVTVDETTPSIIAHTNDQELHHHSLHPNEENRSVTSSGNPVLRSGDSKYTQHITDSEENDGTVTTETRPHSWNIPDQLSKQLKQRMNDHSGHFQRQPHRRKHGKTVTFKEHDLTIYPKWRQPDEKDHHDDCVVQQAESINVNTKREEQETDGISCQNPRNQKYKTIDLDTPRDFVIEGRGMCIGQVSDRTVFENLRDSIDEKRQPRLSATAETRLKSLNFDRSDSRKSTVSILDNTIYPMKPDSMKIATRFEPVSDGTVYQNYVQPGSFPLAQHEVLKQCKNKPPDKTIYQNWKEPPDDEVDPDLQTRTPRGIDSTVESSSKPIDKTIYQNFPEPKDGIEHSQLSFKSDQSFSKISVKASKPVLDRTVYQNWEEPFNEKFSQIEKEKTGEKPLPPNLDKTVYQNIQESDDSEGQPPPPPPIDNDTITRKLQVKITDRTIYQNVEEIPEQAKYLQFSKDIRHSGTRLVDKTVYQNWIDPVDEITNLQISAAPHQNRMVPSEKSTETVPDKTVYQNVPESVEGTGIAQYHLEQNHTNIETRHLDKTVYQNWKGPVDGRGFSEISEGKIGDKPSLPVLDKTVYQNEQKPDEAKESQQGQSSPQHINKDAITRKSQVKIPDRTVYQNFEEIPEQSTFLQCPKDIRYSGARLVNKTVYQNWIDPDEENTNVQISVATHQDRSVTSKTPTKTVPDKTVYQKVPKSIEVIRNAHCYLKQDNSNSATRNFDKTVYQNWVEPVDDKGDPHLCMTSQKSKDTGRNYEVRRPDKTIYQNWTEPVVGCIDPGPFLAPHEKVEEITKQYPVTIPDKTVYQNFNGTHEETRNLQNHMNKNVFNSERRNLDKTIYNWTDPNDGIRNTEKLVTPQKCITGKTRQTLDVVRDTTVNRSSCEPGEEPILSQNRVKQNNVSSATKTLDKTFYENWTEPADNNLIPVCIIAPDKGFRDDAKHPSQSIANRTVYQNYSEPSKEGRISERTENPINLSSATRNLDKTIYENLTEPVDSIRNSENFVTRHQYMEGKTRKSSKKVLDKTVYQNFSEPDEKLRISHNPVIQSDFSSATKTLDKTVYQNC